MRVLLAMVEKDLRRRARAPLATLLLLLFPLILGGVMALTFGGREAKVPKVRLLIEDRDHGLVARLVTGAFNQGEAQQYFEVKEVEGVAGDGADLIEREDATALLRLPADFSSSVLAGRPTRLELIQSPAQSILPDVARQATEVLGEALSSASGLLRQPLDRIARRSSEGTGEQGWPSNQSVSEIATVINETLSRARPYLFPPVITLETGSPAPPSERGSPAGADRPRPSPATAAALPPGPPAPAESPPAHLAPGAAPANPPGGAARAAPAAGVRLAGPASAAATAGSSPGSARAGAARLPSIFLLLLPGFAVYALFNLADQTMRDLLIEARLRTLRRQLAAPVTVGWVLAGKALATAAVGGISILILTAVGGAFAPRAVDVAGFALLSLALVVATTGFASAVFGLARNEKQGATLASLLSLVMAFAGGSFIPLDSLPVSMRALSPFSLMYWATAGYQRLVSDGRHLPDVLPHIAVLAGVGFLLLALAMPLWRRRLGRGELA